MDTATGTKNDQRGCSTLSSGLDQDHQAPRQQASTFLNFIRIIKRFHIHIVDQSIADPQQRAEAAVGILGKGGQYIVDRTYSNQRYADSILLQ